MNELQLGDGVLMKAFKWHSPDGFAVLSYGGPKPKLAFHLFMWLGVYSDDGTIASDLSADDRLNRLGWVFDPDRAAQAIEARRAETAKTGSVEDESAVAESDAPNPLEVKDKP